MPPSSPQKNLQFKRFYFFSFSIFLSQPPFHSQHCTGKCLTTSSLKMKQNLAGLMCSLCWLLWCKYPPLWSLTSYLCELTEKHAYSWSRGLELAVSTPLIHAKRQNMAAWASAWLPCSPQMRVCSLPSSHCHLHNDRRTCCYLQSIFLVRGWLLRVFMSLA